MEYYVSCAAMKDLERETDAAGLSYLQMMENAGTVAANRIVEITITSPINDQKNTPGGRTYSYALGRPVRALVFCGKGNNGGDGFVVARLLKERGWEVEIILVDGEPATPDAITNRKRAEEIQIPMRGPAEMKGPVDVVVDAIYGTGFHGRLRENGAAAAEAIRRYRLEGARVFALDIPSGMGGDLEKESELDERCVRADVTITFHAKKKVHLQAFSEEYCGRVLVADIGIVDAGTGNVDYGTGNVDCGRDEKDYSFTDFVDIVSRLRGPDGCPWDRAQTHQTLKKYLLEETGEAAQAIDAKDDENFCEELGDVLLQIVLNAQLAKERDAFTIDDVIRGISEKMIRRHPWVFGDMHVDSPEEGERLWEEIKKKEKARAENAGKEKRG